MDRPSEPRPLDEGDLASHALFLRRLAKRLVRDDARADDVAQETWRAALANPPAEVGSWRGWLAAAARNVARQMVRGGARRARHERAAAVRERLPSADEVAARLEAERRLIDAVAALPDDDRALILLRHFDGLPPRAIARRMQAPVETVKTRLKRALERLRERLVVRGGDPRRLHSGLLLVANGLVGKVGAAGGVVAGVVAMSAKSKLLVAAAIVVLAAGAIRVAMESGDRRDATTTHSAQLETKDSASNAVADEAARIPALDTATSPESAAPPSHADAIAFEPDPEGTAVVGRFVSRNGAPLEGVEVSSRGYGRDGPPWIERPGFPTTRSGSDGRFAWSMPSSRSPGNARDAWAQSVGSYGWADALVVGLHAWRPGYALQEFQLTGAMGRAFDAGDLVLERESRIAGRVVVPAGVDPSTVTVVLESTNDPFARSTLAPMRDFIRRVRIDAEGHFEFVGLGRGLLRAWAWAPGIPRVPSPLVPLDAGEARDDLLLTLVPRESRGAPLSIEVQDPDGAPLPGAHVSVAFREWGRGIETYLDFVADPDGHVDVETYGDPVVAAWAWSDDHRWLPAERLFEAGTARDCVLRLSTLVHVELDVRSSDGLALNDLYARVSENEPRFHLGFGWSFDSRDDARRSAAATGRLELRVPDSPVTIELTADGCADQKLGPLLVRSLSGPLVVTMESRPVLTGRVTHAGIPVAGASIAVLGRSGDGRWTVVNGVPSRAHVWNSTVARTDGDGRYRIVEHGCGPLLVRAHALGFAPGTIGPIESTNETARSDLDIELTRGGSLAGQVDARADGSRARFVVISNGDGAPRSWPVDADGTFEIDHLVAGAWNVRTSEQEIPLNAYRFVPNVPAIGELPSNCIVRDGETTTITISSDDTLACIVRCEVLGRGDVRELWGAWLGERDVPLERVWSGADPVPVAIARDGRIECRFDVPGRARLVLFRRSDEPTHDTFAAFLQDLDLKQGITRVTTRLALGTIEGDLGDRAGGRPLAVVADGMTADGIVFRGGTKLRPDGRFTLPNVPAGSIRVRVPDLSIEGSVVVELGATTSVALR